MWNTILGTSAILFALMVGVHSFGSGAPPSTCSSQTPGHGSQPNSVSPYSIEVSAPTYTPGQSLTVNVNGGDYQGIILQARVQGTNTIVGTFSSPQGSTNTQVMQCAAASDTITHSSTAAKNSAVTYTWTAPSSAMGTLEFVATVAQLQNTWWKNVKSSSITADSAGTGETTDPTQNNNNNNGSNDTEDSSEDDSASNNTQAPAGQTTTPSKGLTLKTDIISVLLIAVGIQALMSLFLNKMQ